MRYAYSAFILLVLLSSCTPLRVVRVEPVSKDFQYDYGQQVVTESIPTASVAVSYYDATAQYLVFNMSVENTGDYAINFDAASCQLVPDVGPVSSAIDPEVQLLSMDMDQMQRARKQRTFAWVGAGLLVAGVVADASGLVGGAGDAVGNISLAEELALSTADAVVFTVANTVAQNSRVAGAEPSSEIPVPESRYFWLDHSLRITTIQPGERAFGKVVFPRNDEATNFSLQVRIEDQVLTVPFKQKVFR